MLKTYLETLVQSREQAVEASAGWGGDRFLVLERPLSGKYLVWLIAWDSVEDAQEFFNLVATSTDLPQEGYAGISADRVLLIIGPSRGSVDRILAHFPDFE